MKVLLPVIIIATSLVGCVVVAPGDSSQGNHQQPSGSHQSSDLNDPGSWAYKGCKQALLNDIRQKHPQVQDIQIEGQVTETKETNQKSELTGQAKYRKNGDMRHITFACSVDRSGNQIQHVNYDKD